MPSQVPAITLQKLIADALDIRKTISGCEEVLSNLSKLHELCATALHIVAAEADPIERRRLEQELTMVPTQQMVNGLQLTTLFYFEAACLLDDLSRATKHRRALYACLLILSMYESCLTLRAVLGREFQKEMVEKLGPEVEPPLRSAHKSVHSLFERINERFGDIRNGLAGHRSKDAFERDDLLSKVDEQDAAVMAIQVVQALSPIGRHCILYLTACMRLMATFVEMHGIELPAALHSRRPTRTAARSRNRKRGR